MSAPPRPKWTPKSSSTIAATTIPPAASATTPGKVGVGAPKLFGKAKEEAEAKAKAEAEEAAAKAAAEKEAAEAEGREAEERRLAEIEIERIQREAEEREKAEAEERERLRIAEEEKIRLEAEAAERARVEAEAKERARLAKLEAERLAELERLRLEEEARIAAEKARLEEEARVAAEEARVAAAKARLEAEAAAAAAAKAAQLAAIEADWNRLSAPFLVPGMPQVSFICQEDFEASTAREISIREGNKLKVLNLNPISVSADSEAMWLGTLPIPGSTEVRRGLFPPACGQVIVSGELEKKGMGSSVLFSKPYAVRDCIFDGMTGILTYADGQRSKSVDIRSNAVIRMLSPSEADGKSYAFQITCDRVDEEGKKYADKNSLVLVAKSDAIRTCWIGCVNLSLVNRSEDA